MKTLMENWRRHLDEEAPEQMDLPGMASRETSSEPTDDVDNLSSQLAQMVADSPLADEQLGALMDLVYDKIAHLKGLGVEDEEESSDYKRTTMGFMDEVRDIVLEVYSEKQRAWACAQEGAEFEEMCAGPMKKKTTPSKD